MCPSAVSQRSQVLTRAMFWHEVVSAPEIYSTLFYSLSTKLDVLPFLV